MPRVRLTGAKLIARSERSWAVDIHFRIPDAEDPELVYHKEFYFGRSIAAWEDFEPDIGIAGSFVCEEWVKESNEKQLCEEYKVNKVQIICEMIEDDDCALADDNKPKPTPKPTPVGEPLPSRVDDDLPF